MDSAVSDRVALKEEKNCAVLFLAGQWRLFNFVPVFGISTTPYREAGCLNLPDKIYLTTRISQDGIVTVIDLIGGLHPGAKQADQISILVTCVCMIFNYRDYLCIVHGIWWVGE